MKISIITISYNQAQFLEQTIISVLEQDYPDIEYIVVDAGSTDGSREIIDKYKERISKTIFEPDKGPADGLNKGFSYATDTVLGYLNSDDYYLPQSFSKIIKFFITYRDCDVVSGNAHIVNDKNQLLRLTYSDKYALLPCAYGFSNLLQPSSFFKKSIFQKTQGFNIHNRSNWDGELFIDMHHMGAKFFRINEFLSAYRVYDSNITGSGKMDKLIADYSAYRFKKIMGRDKNFSDKFIGELIFRPYRYLTNPRDVCQRVRFGPIYSRYKNRNH